MRPDALERDAHLRVRRENNVLALDGDRHAVVDTRVWAALEQQRSLDGRTERLSAADYVAVIEPIREETFH